MNIDSEEYATQLKEKISVTTQLLAPHVSLHPLVYSSPPEGFRQRTEFRMWHEDDALDYVMFDRQDPKTPIPVTDFPIAAVSIQSLMPVLRDLLTKNPVLRKKLFQVEFLSTLAGDMVVTLIYHRRLDEEWEHQAEALRTSLATTQPEISIIGRSRRQKIVLGRDYANEALTIQGTVYRYRQYEQSFSQPNAVVNQSMITWACERAESLSGCDLLELYCGNGNFTLPLARHFNRVLASEVAKSSIKAANENITANEVDNVFLLRMSAEEMTDALDAKRTFRRIQALPVSLDDLSLRTVFVDPPRAGLDDHTRSTVARFPSIIYISCNPQTLARDLNELCKSHRVTDFALFDQFPYTHHMECGIILQSR